VSSDPGITIIFTEKGPVKTYEEYMDSLPAPAQGAVAGSTDQEPEGQDN